MNMIPTMQMQQNLKDLLNNTPLQKGELRRIEGMGGLYVSLSREIEEEGYEFMYSLGIDDVVYYFFGRIK
jgi:hypothetical protein